MRLFYNVKFVLQAMAEWPVKKTKEDSRSENPPFQYPQPCRIRTDFSRPRPIVGNASLDTRARETYIPKTQS